MDKKIIERLGSPSFSAVVTILMGVIMIIWPENIVSFLLKIIGIFLLVWGAVPIIYSFTKKTRVSILDAILLVSGLMILVFSSLFQALLMWIFGLVLIIGAIRQFNQLSDAKRVGYYVAGNNYIYPAALMILGIITLVNPFSTQKMLVIFFGFGLLFYGITTIFAELAITRNNK